MELTLTLASVGIAALGFFLAYLFYYKNPALPKRMAEGAGGLYRTVLNKYYVDELYGALFVRPIVLGSTKILWRGIDATLIDGTINQSAEGAQEASDTLRRMQSGNIRSYAAWVTAGAACVIAYMVWRGLR
jgi:NADH-quinone oxidoreductase subunit L